MLGPKDEGPGEVPNQEHPTEEYSSVDELAKGMAIGGVSRGKALKLMGAAILGAFGLTALFADPAEARRRRRRRRRVSGSACRSGDAAVICPAGYLCCAGEGKVGCCPPGSRCSTPPGTCAPD